MIVSPFRVVGQLTYGLIIGETMMLTGLSPDTQTYPFSWSNNSAPGNVFSTKSTASRKVWTLVVYVTLPLDITQIFLIVVASQL